MLILGTASLEVLSNVKLKLHADAYKFKLKAFRLEQMYFAIHKNVFIYRSQFDVGASKKEAKCKNGRRKTQCDMHKASF